MNNRNYTLDNLKGILIYLMVFAHVLLQVAYKGSGLCYEVSTYIYFFHMPLFLFISGILTKKDTNKDFFNKFIFLYIFFNGLYALFSYYFLNIEIDLLSPYYSMWYILVLVVYKGVIKLSSDNKLLFPLSIFISIIVPFLNIENNNIFSIVRLFMFFPYFLLGYFYKEQWLKNIDKYKKVIATIVSAVLFYFIYLFTKATNLPIDFYTTGEGTSSIHFFLHAIVLAINLLLCACIIHILPNKKIPVLITLGQNTLPIYLLHRPLTLMIPFITWDKPFFFISIGMAILICFALGNKLICKAFDKIIELLLNSNVKYFVYLILSIAILFTVNLNNRTIDKKYPIIKEDELEECTKISFIGDMLLFENDINRVEDFSNYFRYTKDYFGDYVIGVFEGAASDGKRFSTGNYYDNKELRLIYPEKFVEEVSKNIDFVTIGMNHLLDNGAEGVSNTINVLNKYNIDFTGGYRNQKENDEIKVINANGISCAILSYTYGMNYESDAEEYMFNSLNEQEILKDIENAKKKNVDLIIAMLHIGTEFYHGTTEEQNYWNDFFAKYGVDIVLADHAHVTEPIEYIGNTLIVNCAGNYATSLSTCDQQYGAICNIYIDNKTKEIKTTSIVPIKTIVTNNDIYPITCYELNDIAVSNIVTSSMIGTKFDYVLKEYYFNQDGYLVLEPKKEISLENTSFYDYVDKDDSICFIGDSVTAGTKNGGIGWYQALDLNNIGNLSIGGATTETLINMANSELDYDCYIIAIGCNDIRYSNTSSEEYVKNIDKITAQLGKNKKYIFVSPWYSLNSDFNSILDYNSRNNAIENYNKRLSEYCKSNNYRFIDTYSYLKEFFDNEPFDYRYLQDGIHPNSTDGVKLYSEAFYYMFDKKTP